MAMVGCGEDQESSLLTVKEFTKPVSLVYQQVIDYTKADGATFVTSFLPTGMYRFDKAVSVTVTYDTKEQVQSAKVEVSRSADFSTIEKTVDFPTRGKSARLTNLLTGATYYFKVVLTLTNGKTIYRCGNFETVKSVRMLDIDGASNVRDIGGWKTEDGREIKQGVLFRGGEIDGGKNTGHADFKLTAYGISQLRELGVKTDFDLRSESVKVSDYSILGEDISRTFYDSAQYQSILEPENAERTRRIFSDLSKPEAYPAYIHCTHGVDRAGSITLLLEGLLGVSKQDLIKDYELSAFYHNYKHINREVENGGNILALIEGIEGFEGQTFAQKVENFMLSIGVTAQEIASIRNIFLV